MSNKFNDLIDKLEASRLNKSRNNKNSTPNIFSNIQPTNNIFSNHNPYGNNFNLSADLSKMKKDFKEAKEIEQKNLKEKEKENMNIEKFDINELLVLFKITEDIEDLTLDKVQFYTDDFINKIPDTHSNIKDMLLPSQDKIIKYFTEKSKINSNKVENNNISLLTVEKDNIDDSKHNIIIPRTTLDNKLSYDAPVKQGKLNPKLENIIQRTLVIDSRYRQFNYYPLNTSTDDSSVNTNPFTIDLEYPVTDLLSFKLFSLHIPLVWNNISAFKRNNIFFISKYDINELEDLVDNPMEYLARDVNGNLFLDKEAELVCKSNFIPVIIPDNKYSTIDEIINEINTAIKESIDYYNTEIFPKCTNNLENNDMITAEDIKFVHNEKFNKIEIVIKRGSVKFFTMHNDVKLDYSLGWMLGFRKLFYAYDSSNVNDDDKTVYHSEALYDISDTKYVMIYIDDFLQNRINTNIECSGDSTVASTTTSGKNTITDMPIAKDLTNLNEYQKIIKEVPTTQSSDFVYLPMKPRTHTQKEIYAFSQTQSGENSLENTFKNSRLKPPVTTNCFALIPIKGTSANTDENNYPYIDFSGSLQAHERKYFGPVNLRRLKITLVDDKGFVLDLKGLNWSFVIQCEVLYQY